MNGNEPNLSQASTEPESSLTNYISVEKQIDSMSDPVSAIIISPTKRDQLIQKLATEGFTSRDLERSLEPEKRLDGQENASVIVLDGNVNKIVNFYTALQKSNLPEAQTLMSSVHQLLRASVIDSGQKFSSAIANRDKDIIKGAEENADKVRGFVEKAVTDILSQTKEGSNTLPVDIIADTAVEPQYAIEAMTDKQLSDLLYTLCFPSAGAKVPKAFIISRGKIRPEWITEILHDALEGSGSDQQSIEKAQNILKGFLFDEGRGRNKSVEDRIIEITSMIQKNHEILADNWQEMLNSVLPANYAGLTVTEKSTYNWVISWPNGTKSEIDSSGTNNNKSSNF
jgi:hypothetical protein